MKLPIDLSGLDIPNDDDAMPDDSILAGAMLIYWYLPPGEAKPRTAFARSLTLTDNETLGALMALSDYSRQKMLRAWMHGDD